MESALVVLVPEAERVVKPFRDSHDPSAALGMPAHITLLYPFIPPGKITLEVIDRLTQCFHRFSPFCFTLKEARRFPGVLYLAPEPGETFRKLTLAIWEMSPATPPYRGRHADVVPHLSVAQLENENELDAVAEAFARATRSSPPIRADASTVALMDNRAGRWNVRRVLCLGAGGGPEP
jgi:2'-5' RNA ligase superfamily